MSAHYQFRPQICQKPVKIQKNRYKSLINKISVIFEKSKIDFKSTGSVPVSLQPLATLTDDYLQLYMLSTFPCIEIPSSIEKSKIQTAVPQKVLGIRANP